VTHERIGGPVHRESTLNRRADLAVFPANPEELRAMRLPKLILFASLLVTAMITMTACGVSGSPQAQPAQVAEKVVVLPSPSAPPPPTVAKTQKRVEIYSGPSDQPVVEEANTAPGSHALELKTTTSEQIGGYLADGDGRTLYRFDNDSNKPPKSTCDGDCAKTWPALPIASPGKIYPTGVDPQLIGYVERADGTCQVTVNGWPVYYFSGDKAPGDLNGQGVKGTWFAVSPTGAKTPPLPGK
jgi:predicted lipoprotein with Yx(FWY)xxD motif